MQQLDLRVEIGRGDVVEGAAESIGGKIDGAAAKHQRAERDGVGRGFTGRGRGRLHGVGEIPGATSVAGDMNLRTIDCDGEVNLMPEERKQRIANFDSGNMNQYAALPGDQEVMQIDAADARRLNCADRNLATKTATDGTIYFALEQLIEGCGAHVDR